MTAHAPRPRQPRRRRSNVGPVAWLRANLFSSWGNAVLTLLGAVASSIGRRARVIDWAFFSATFDRRATARACTREGAGACWPFVTAQVRPVHVRPLSRRRALARQPHLCAGARRPRAADDPARAGQAVARRSTCSSSSRSSRFVLLRGGVFGLPHRRRPSCGAGCWSRWSSPASASRVVPARHPAGAGPALEAADRALGVDRLHRVRARRAADHRAVHGLGDAAAVPAARA